MNHTRPTMPQTPAALASEGPRTTIDVVVRLEGIRAIAIGAGALGTLLATTMVVVAASIGASRDAGATTVPPLASQSSAPVLVVSPAASSEPEAGAPDPCTRSVPEAFVQAVRRARVTPILGDKKIDVTRKESLGDWVRRAFETGNTKDGSKVKESSRGRPVVVFLGRTDCGPCKEQAAGVAHLARKFGRDVTLVGLLAEDASPEAHATYRRAFEGEGIPYAFWPEGEELGFQSGLRFPTVLLLESGTATRLCAGAIYRRTNQGEELERWLANPRP